MLAESILQLLKQNAGLSDREIADSLFGSEKPQQPVNQLCRKLEQRGLIKRFKRPDGRLGNYLADTTIPPVAPCDSNKTTNYIPVQLAQKARELGVLWAESNTRPRLDPIVKKHWDELIDGWASSELPLVARKSNGVRGGVIMHHDGREIVLADNSPAQWAFSRALSGHMYSLDDLRAQLSTNSIPFVYATKRAELERMKYRATLRPADNVNKRGWKLCHIDGVGLKSATLLEELPLSHLVEHFKRLIKPSNHFLVPLSWSGLGEIPEVIHEIRKYEHATDT
jgi:hypothetical protein